MSRDELAPLLAAAADGTLSTEQGARLLAACQADAAVQRTLVAHLATERLLHAVERDPAGRLTAQELALRLEHERVAAAQRTDAVPQVVDKARRPWWEPRLALAAAVLLGAGVAAIFWPRNAVVPEAQFAADGPPWARLNQKIAVAVLKRAVGVEWADAAAAPALGEMLPAGWLRLRAGTVQVEFLSGARLLVAGPAEVRLDGPGAVFLQSGKASAYVPEPARGFALRAPGFAVVDLGTAFGVEVSGLRPPEVHVFAGQVELTRSAAKAAPHPMQAGEAVQLDGPGLRAIPVRPADFPTGEELAKQAALADRSQAQAWKAAMQELRANPATLLSYTFDDETQASRSVLNRAGQAITESHGALVGAGWTGGRWPGKRALEFRSPGDRLRFTLPGRHPAITLMTWVRVDSLPNDYNPLLLPSRYEAGSLHWMLERGGELRLTMLKNPKRPLNPDSWDGPVSGPAVSNMDFGRWIFLATSYDSSTGTVTHYRDGRKIGSARFPGHLPAVFGPVEFGNWGAGHGTQDTAWTKKQLANQRTRNFVGRLDELTILSRALPAAEIARLYQVGKP